MAGEVLQGTYQQSGPDQRDVGSTAAEMDYANEVVRLPDARDCTPDTPDQGHCLLGTDPNQLVRQLAIHPDASHDPLTGLPTVSVSTSGYVNDPADSGLDTTGRHNPSNGNAIQGDSGHHAWSQSLLAQKKRSHSIGEIGNAEDIAPIATSTPATAGVPVPAEHQYPDRSGTWPEVMSLKDSYPRRAMIYSAVKSRGRPNAKGARIPVPSGLHVPAWRRIATGHPHDITVLEGITYGFSLQYYGPPLPSGGSVVNHQSASMYPEQVEKYIEKEVREGALLGPFEEKPFTWQHVSPLMSRPKSSQDDCERRIIVDLSFPPEANVNEYIPQNEIYGVRFPHRLPTTDNLVEILQEDEFRGFMYSIDIARAYRNFPIDPLDWPLTGISFKGVTFTDSPMPFGARSSSLNMQLAAEYIARYLRDQGLMVLIYLDDLVGYARDLEVAWEHYHFVGSVMGDLGLPLAEKKVTPPAREIVWLGILVDADSQTLSIPEGKLTEIVAVIRLAYSKKRMTRRDVQSLAGKINHLSKACRPARLFMARILAYLRAHPTTPTIVPQSVRADLKWFMDFLPEYNSVSLIPPREPAFNIEADSCLRGGGALGDGVCYMHQYNQTLAQAHISQLEAINCMAAVRALVGTRHRGLTIMVECDNSAAVTVFINGRGRDPVILACARAIWRHAAAVDCALRFKHTPGDLMHSADALSRACLSPRHEMVAWEVVRDRQLNVIMLDDEMFDYSYYL